MTPVRSSFFVLSSAGQATPRKPTDRPTDQLTDRPQISLPVDIAEFLRPVTCTRPAGAMKRCHFHPVKKNMKQLSQFDDYADVDACSLSSSSMNLLHKSLDCQASQAVSRIVVVGPSCVGKTSIISRFLTGDYVDGYTPTGEQYHRKEISVSGQRFVLDVVDTSGRSELPLTLDSSILTGDAFLLVFSLTSEETFGQMRTFRDQIVRIRGADVPIVVIGNKSDVRERRVDRRATARLVSVDWNHSYVETSAAANVNVTAAFREILTRVKASNDLLTNPTGHVAPTKLSRRIRAKWLQRKKTSCVVS